LTSGLYGEKMTTDSHERGKRKLKQVRRAAGTGTENETKRADDR
jgi:hypothetical protein